MWKTSFLYPTSAGPQWVNVEAGWDPQGTGSQWAEKGVRGVHHMVGGCALSVIWGKCSIIECSEERVMQVLEKKVSE